MNTTIKTTAAALALAACGWACRVGADAINKVIPAPAVDTPAAEATGPQTAVLAGGCFWGLQGMFEHVQGVTKVVAGYSGGARRPRTTRWWAPRRPATPSRWRSPSIPRRSPTASSCASTSPSPTIPPSSTARARTPAPATARRSSSARRPRSASPRPTSTQLTKAKVFKAPIVTKIEPLKGFYPAEDYHQDFLIHNPTYPLHRAQRPAQDRRAEEGLSGALPRDAGGVERQPLDPAPGFPSSEPGRRRARPLFPSLSRFSNCSTV